MDQYHTYYAVEALQVNELRLISLVKFQGGQYVISEGGIDATTIPVHTSHKNPLRQTNANVEYMEKETNYVFERTSA